VCDTRIASRLTIEKDLKSPKATELAGFSPVNSAMQCKKS
jgi:hypothetical protein